MISYLKNFFEEFSYENSDSEYLISSYKKICENPSALDIWNGIIGLYDADTDCEYMEMIASADKVAQMLYIHEYTVELLLFICMSKRLKERYIEKGIDLQLYHNTMLDLRYKLDECKLVRSIVGSFAAIWFIDFFKMRRFGIGRLQFGVVPLGYTYDKGDIHLTPETKVLNIHIPRSLAPLDEESCNEACEMAKEYFKGQ